MPRWKRTAAAMAGLAGFGLAVGRTRAVAGLAFVERRDLDGLLGAEDGFLERQLHHVADVGAATRAALGAATEDVAEDVAKDVAHIGVALTAATAHAVLERGVAVLVVGATAVAVRQDFVGFLALLERSFRGGIARVAVRMELHRAAAIGLLQVFVAGVAGHAQHFVVVAFAHGAIRDS